MALKPINIKEIIMQNETKSRTLTLILTFTLFLITILNLNNISEYIYAFIWIILFGIAFFLNSKESKDEYSKNYIHVLFVIFVIFGFASTVINKLMDTYNYYQNTILLYFIQILIPLFVVFYTTKKCNAELFLKYYRNIMFIFSILGLFEYVTKIQIYTWLINSQLAENNFLKYGSVALANYRTTLIFYHPIYYSVLLVVFFAILLYLPLKNTFLQVIAILLGIINIILTQSRSGWLGIGVVLLLFLIKSKKKNSLKFFESIIALCCFGLVCVQALPNLYLSLQNILNSRIQELFLGNASGARVANLSLINYIDNLYLAFLGGGDQYANSLLINHPSINNWTNAVDNQFLTFVLNFGWIGLGLIIIFLILCINALIHEGSNINQLLLISIIAIFSCSYFFEFYSNNIINYLLFILIGFYTQKSINKF